jgi:hypothetical protein
MAMIPMLSEFVSYCFGQRASDPEEVTVTLSLTGYAVFVNNGSVTFEDDGRLVTVEVDNVE